MKLKNLPFRRKLFLVMVLVGITPSILLGVILFQRSLRLLTERKTDDMENSLTQITQAMESRRQAYEEVLRFLALDDEVQEALKTPQTPQYETAALYAGVDEAVQYARSLYEGLKGVSVFSEHFRISHDNSLLSMEKLQETGWLPAIRSKTEEGRMIWFEDGGGDNLYAFMKVPGTREEEAYIEMVCWTNQFISSGSYYVGADTGFAILGTDGKIIYHQAIYGTEDISSFSDEAFRKNYLSVTGGAEGLPFGVIVYAPVEEPVIAGLQVLPEILLLELACLVLILMVSTWLSGRLVRRIERLTSSIERVDYETMEIDLPDDEEDEIGILVRAFKRMLSEIKHLISEVYQGQIRQQRLEMTALVAQINPHFLYNTLSMINWKALAAGQQDISRATLALSNFYRTTLNKGESMIAIEGEIRNIRAYIEITQMMHDDCYQIHWDLAPSDERAMMPKLVLQPIVENALIHGLDMKEEGEKNLFISCHTETDQDDTGVEYQVNCWEVQDDGVGMTEEEIRKVLGTEKSSGYGMRNVNERLILLYGENYALHMDSRLGEGTRVIVRIPEKILHSTREEGTV